MGFLFFTGLRTITVNGDSNHDTAEDHLVFDESLERELSSTTGPQFCHFDHDQQPVADEDGGAEPDFFHSAKSEEVALQQFILSCIKPG